MVADKFPNGLIGPIGLDPNGLIGLIGLIGLGIIRTIRRGYHFPRIPPLLAPLNCCQKGLGLVYRKRRPLGIVL